MSSHASFIAFRTSRFMEAFSYQLLTPRACVPAECCVPVFALVVPIQFNGNWTKENFAESDVNVLSNSIACAEADL